jgi:hypothetical protein
MSFRQAEVEAVNQLFDLLAQGGDVSVLMRHNDIRHVRAKFHRMRDRIIKQNRELLSEND